MSLLRLAATQLRSRTLRAAAQAAPRQRRNLTLRPIQLSQLSQLSVLLHRTTGARK